MPAEWAPRPYLHPVRTLGGAVVTDVAPADHRWHHGVSVAVPDVGGSNFWGGGTYRRGEGYADRDDHGTVGHREWRERGPSDGGAHAGLVGPRRRGAAARATADHGRRSGRSLGARARDRPAQRHRAGPGPGQPGIRGPRRRRVRGHLLAARPRRPGCHSEARTALNGAVLAVDRRPLRRPHPGVRRARRRPVVRQGPGVPGRRHRVRLGRAAAACPAAPPCGDRCGSRSSTAGPIPPAAPSATRWRAFARIPRDLPRSPSVRGKAVRHVPTAGDADRRGRGRRHVAGHRLARAQRQRRGASARRCASASSSRRARWATSPTRPRRRWPAAAAPVVGLDRAGHRRPVLLLDRRGRHAPRRRNVTSSSCWAPRAAIPTRELGPAVDAALAPGPGRGARGQPHHRQGAD